MAKRIKKIKKKTHKGIAKTMKVHPSGTITRGNSGTHHNTGKKNGKFSRKSRKESMVSKSDQKRLKSLK